METFVIGHRNPDMDSICSAIGYARFKSLIGMPRVAAARAGDTNARIDFVLKKFGVESPLFLSDVSPRISDVMEAAFSSVHENSPVYEAVNIIERKQLRGLPVVNDGGSCVGLLSTFKVSHYLFPHREDLPRARYVRASLADVVKSFEGKILSGKVDSKVRDYFLTVGGTTSKEFSRRLHQYPARDMILIVGDRSSLQEIAIRNGVPAVVVTGGLEVTEEMLKLADENGTVVISSSYDTASTVLTARGAARVAEMVETEFTSFNPGTMLESGRKTARESGGLVFPVVDEENRFVGVVTRSCFLKPIPRQLILVDHNELSQAVAGADAIPIIEILDHHRIGGYSTKGPIHFWNNPVGSTSTIVGLCYRQAGIPIPREIAGLLMAGLISDTLNLTSPTTTETDRELMAHLEEIVGMKAFELAQEIFSVGSPLRELSVGEAILVDCKEYDEPSGRFTVAQIEELGFSEFYSKADDLQRALDESVQKKDLLFAALMVTDIGTNNSLLLMAGNGDVRKAVDYPSAGPRLWELKGVVSRKKQLLPHLLECLRAV
jgi:manganese-dependent inorganic pyrophosphatase